MEVRSAIYTIGHSTHGVNKFIGMLQSFGKPCLMNKKYNYDGKI